jgi:hypothetical protein
MALRAKAVGVDSGSVILGLILTITVKWPRSPQSTGFAFTKTDFLNTLVKVTAVNHPERSRRVQIEANARNPFLRGLEVYLNLDGELGFDAAPHRSRGLECENTDLVPRREAPVVSFIVRESCTSAERKQENK